MLYTQIGKARHTERQGTTAPLRKSLASILPPVRRKIPLQALICSAFQSAQGLLPAKGYLDSKDPEIL
jgi:hypothetical protein